MLLPRRCPFMPFFVSSILLQALKIITIKLYLRFPEQIRWLSVNGQCIVYLWKHSVFLLYPLMQGIGYSEHNIQYYILKQSHELVTSGNEALIRSCLQMTLLHKTGHAWIFCYWLQWGKVAFNTNADKDARGLMILLLQLLQMATCWHPLLYTWCQQCALQWRRNGHNGVLNHQHHHCLLNRWFRRRSQKTPKLHTTGLCVGNSPLTGEFPHRWPVTRKMFQFDDVIMCPKLFLPNPWMLFPHNVVAKLSTVYKPSLSYFVLFSRWNQRCCSLNLCRDLTSTWILHRVLKLRRPSRYVQGTVPGPHSRCGKRQPRRRSSIRIHTTREKQPASPN